MWVGFFLSKICCGTRAMNTHNYFESHVMMVGIDDGVIISNSMLILLHRGTSCIEVDLYLSQRSIESPQLLPVLLEVIATEVTRKVNDIEELKDFWTKVGSKYFCTVNENSRVLNLHIK